MKAYLAYILTALGAGAFVLWASLNWDKRQVDSFYGFADTAQTEVNTNYAIEILEILVAPGEAVRKGQVLMRVQRARDKATLADQDFRINELKAKQQLILSKLDGDLIKLEAQAEAERVELKRKIVELERQQAFRTTLLGAVVERDELEAQVFSPLKEEIQTLQDQLTALEESFAQQTAALKKERRLANQPLEIEAERLAAERDFDLAQQEIAYDILAPGDGVIGAINGKIAEHKSSFAPLLIFYDPHPRQVKAYIHEERLLSAAVGDSVFVRALSDPEGHIGGVITGLGSRIVEIPARLRKFPEVQTYGREVIISVPPHNPFLQKEKVEIGFVEDGVR